MVCTFIGAQAMVDTDKTGGRNPLVDAAQDLDILGGGARSEAERELDEMRGPMVARRAEDDPRLQMAWPVAADPEAGVEASNPAGSFEGFLTLMGGGAGKPAMPGAEQATEGGEDLSRTAGPPTGRLSTGQSLTSVM